MMFFKNQKRKKKAIVFIICLLVAAGFSGYLFLYKKTANGEKSEESTIVTEQETDINEGTNLVEMGNLVENEMASNEEYLVEDDWRIHGFSYIKLTGQLRVGDYVDVRISFADGGDFVLLSKKQIQGLAPLQGEGTNALWLIVSEEEILRLSSAVVDAYLNEGCYIYAIQYISDTQKEAVVNYVVSDTVKQLMDENPNIVKRAENVQEYSLWKEYETNIQREESYPEQDEIIYMD